MSALSAAGPRARLAAAVGELNDLVLFGDLDESQLEELEAGVQKLLGTPGRRPGWWNEADPVGQYRARSPFTGTENPRSPRLRIDPDDVTPTRVRGRVSLGPAFAGPPGAVHGGVLAGLFDEVCGALAGHAIPGRVVVTGRLTVRYRRPTPLRADLTFSARVISSGSRRLLIAAECGDTAGRTAEAEALMVVR